MRPNHFISLRDLELTPADAVALLLLLTTICAAPWFYGGVTPTGQLAIQLSSFSCAIVTLAGARRRAIGGASIAIAALCTLGVFGILQAIPLPDSVLTALSPQSSALYASARDTVTLAGGAPRFAPAISLAPAETLRTVMLLAAYVSVFYAAAALLTNRARRRLALMTIVVSGTAVLIAAAITGPGGLQKVLEGSPRLGLYEGRIHGPFISPNHFAGYMEIGLAAAFAFLWSEVLTNRERAAAALTPQERFEQRMPPLAWRVLLWAVFAAGIALSRSRGGLVAAVVATVAAIAAGSMHGRAARHRRAIAMISAVVVACAVLFVAVTARTGSIVRFMAVDLRDRNTDVRPALWAASWETWQLYPLTGAGLGSFMEAFRPQQPAEISTSVEQAHNDYLQILVTGGVTGAALVTIAFGSFAALLLVALRRQRHREESALLLAGLAVLVSLGVHAVTEFNFSIPAIPVTLALFAGCVWSARPEEAQVSVRASASAPSSRATGRAAMTRRS